MSSLLVNGTYPLDYFTLAGVDEIPHPDTSWWSSKQRFAAVDADENYLAVSEGGTPTVEYLEIDLGRDREVNFVNLSALRVPVDITIEYDAVSLNDGSHEWVGVERIVNMPFDDALYYDANNKSAWFDAYFYFNDPKGDLVHTRFLRIGFHRRDEAWPVSSASPFVYPIFVEKLRAGRYVSKHLDTAGLLFSYLPSSPTLADLPALADSTSREVRQRFVYPTDGQRGDLTPNLLGAGVLIDATIFPPAQDEIFSPEVSYGWSLWDVTSTPTLLTQGVESGIVNQGRTWLDFYFDNPVTGDASVIYELRVKSLNTLASAAVYTATPNLLSNTPVPGTLTFTHGSTSVATTVDTRAVVKVGDYLQKSDTPEQIYVVNAVGSSTITINIPYGGTTQSGASAAVVYPSYQFDSNTQDYLADATTNIVVRIWADVADEGRDLLGNSYRYATHIDDPSFVFDGTKAGWMSAPQPSPDAVEALYFDVRTTDDDGQPAYAILDAVRVAPRTPGVQMQVYYSKEGLRGDKPQTVTEWDNLLWTPVNNTYILRKDAVFVLPQAISAAYIKLEFTSLNPLPFRIPSYPKLPPVFYRRYPTWIEQQFDNVNLRGSIQDWFVKNATVVQTKILETLSDPILEFQYQEHEFLAALALGQIKDTQTVNSGLIDTAAKALIDPVTAQRVFISSPNDYQSTLLLSVDQNTILGQTVINRYDPKLTTQPSELAAPDTSTAVPFVSTINNRVSEAYQNLAQSPMRFNRVCRHDYRVQEASFNKKAYFVGIDEVQFLRSNTTVKHDDPIISDDLFNDDFTLENTWIREGTTEITDGQQLYVSYQVGDDTVVDEVIIFGAYNQTPLLTGNAPARNIKVYAGAGQTGQQYFQGDDYTLGYRRDDLGILHTTIGRSSDTARLVVPRQATPFIDVGTVTGRAFIPSPPTLDAATVTGTANLTAIAASDEGPYAPNYGTGVEGGGVYGDLRSHYTEAATVSAVAVPSSSLDLRNMVESGTVTGAGHPSATGSYTPSGGSPTGSP